MCQAVHLLALYPQLLCTIQSNTDATQIDIWLRPNLHEHETQPYHVSQMVMIKITTHCSIKKFTDGKL
jgi:hypothetical protein